jgi:2-polyprenyl-6-methoxyphenol hydroxylase-like FAD-dependent oxidoreductase
MPDKKSFKVIIAGGGISGLSLANMLQKNGIDYILLEAYPDIAPQVGASIGLLPHGTRVLDQLGMYEDIRKLVSPLDHFFMRNDKGELIADHKGAAESFIERYVE